MKTLIWSDIHTRHRLLQTFLDKNRKAFGHAILGGDYFDDFFDTEFQNMETARWLKDVVLYDEFFTPLTGNHDNYYRYETEHTKGSGFTWEKYRAINSILTEQDWDRLRQFTQAGKYLISHAGFSKYIYSRDNATLNMQDIEGICQRAVESAKIGFPNQAFMAGRSRGGRLKKGGHVWQCWRELVPTEMPQIVFHTPQEKPRIKFFKGIVLKEEDYLGQDQNDATLKYAVCMDTHNHHFGILEDDKLTVHKTDDWI